MPTDHYSRLEGAPEGTSGGGSTEMVYSTPTSLSSSRSSSPSLTKLSSSSSSSAFRSGRHVGLLLCDLPNVGRPVHQYGRQEEDEYIAWRKWKVFAFLAVWGYSLVYVIDGYWDTNVTYNWFFAFLTNIDTTLLCIYFTTSLIVVWQQSRWDVLYDRSNSSSFRKKPDGKEDTDQEGIYYKNTLLSSSSSSVDSSVKVPLLLQINNVLMHLAYAGSLAIAVTYLMHLNARICTGRWCVILDVTHVLPPLITMPEAFFTRHPFRLKLIWIPFMYIVAYLMWCLIFELCGGFALYSFLDWYNKPASSMMFYAQESISVVVSHVLYWLVWRAGNRYLPQKRTDELFSHSSRREDVSNKLDVPLAQVEL